MTKYLVMIETEVEAESSAEAQRTVQKQLDIKLPDMALNVVDAEEV